MIRVGTKVDELIADVYAGYLDSGLATCPPYYFYDNFYPLSATLTLAG